MLASSTRYSACSKEKGSDMRSRMLMLAAAVVAVVPAAIAATAGVAQAGSQYNCPAHYVCLWRDASFNGTMIATQLDNNALSTTSLGNDQASAGYNRIDWAYGVKIWEHVDCAGTKNQFFFPGVADSQLNYNDVASSLDVYGQAACGN